MADSEQTQSRGSSPLHPARDQDPPPSTQPKALGGNFDPVPMDFFCKGEEGEGDGGFCSRLYCLFVRAMSLTSYWGSLTPL